MFSIPALQAIVSSGHELAGVITNPEKPAGRGLKKRRTPVAELADLYKANLLTPTTLKNNTDVNAWIDARRPDAIVIAAYGRFIPREILNLPSYGCINIHPSLLPKYRGAAPIQRAFMQGETQTGVTIMKLDEGMDSGPLFMQEIVQINATDNALTLGTRLSELGAELLIKTLSMLEHGNIKPVRQRSELASYAPKINKSEGELNFKKTALELHNTVRALIEWPTAWTYYKGNILQILETQIINEHSDNKPGVILKTDKQGIYIGTSNGVLLIKTVKPAGGKTMNALSYANGKRIKTEDTLG